MECEGFEAVVVDLLYGELPAERKPEVDAHAATCPKCGTLVRELAEARQLASALPARLAPPGELDERIALAARVAAERDVRSFPLRGGALHVAAAVLLVALLSSTGFLLGRMTAPPKKIVVPESPGDVTDRSPGSATPRRERDREHYVKYQEDLLLLGKQKLEKKEFREALTIFQGIFATAGRFPAANEARLGMAEAYLGLANRDEARKAADAVRIDEEQLAPTEEQLVRAQKILEAVNKTADINNEHPR